MYFISMIATIIILYVFTFAGLGPECIVYFVDLPSLTLPILVCIPVLTASGLHKDFFRAFRLAAAGRGKNASLQQKQRAKEAVALVMRTMLLTGVLVTVYCLVLVLPAGPHEYLFADISVSLICLFYTLILSLLLLPLNQALRLRILEHTQESS